MPYRGATLIDSVAAVHSNRTGNHVDFRYEAPGNGGDTVAVYSTQGVSGQDSRIHSASTIHRASTSPGSLPIVFRCLLVPINADDIFDCAHDTSRRLQCQRFDRAAIDCEVRPGVMMRVATVQDQCPIPGEALHPW